MGAAPVWPELGVKPLAELTVKEGNELLVAFRDGEDWLGRCAVIATLLQASAEVVEDDAHSLMFSFDKSNPVLDVHSLRFADREITSGEVLLGEANATSSAIEGARHWARYWCEAFKSGRWRWIAGMNSVELWRALTLSEADRKDLLGNHSYWFGSALAGLPMLKAKVAGEKKRLYAALLAHRRPPTALEPNLKAGFLDFRELAERLGKSPGAVASKLSRLNENRKIPGNAIGERDDGTKLYQAEIVLPLLRREVQTKLKT